MWKRALAVVLLGVVACDGELPNDDDELVESASTTRTTPSIVVHFTDPLTAPGGEDRTILDELVRMIDNTPAGATVRGNIFSISVGAVVDAFARAKARGVRFQITHSGHDANSPAAKRLAVTLGAEHKFCAGACISNSDTGIAHIKFLTFTATTDPNGTRRANVSWWGSANQTYASGVKMFNNALTVYGDDVLFNAFVKHANLMWSEKHYRANDYYDSAKHRGYVFSPETKTSLYMSPEQDLDLWDSRLNDITPDTKCRVRVMHAVIRDSRLAVVRRLVALKRGGCQVWIASETVEPKALATLRAAGIPIRHERVHDKVVLHYSRIANGSEYRYFVLSGSHNLSGSALEHFDELLTRTESQELYGAFYRHFNDAYDRGAPL